jgi:hypothetical protein
MTRAVPIARLVRAKESLRQAVIARLNDTVTDLEEKQRQQKKDLENTHRPVDSLDTDTIYVSDLFAQAQKKIGATNRALLDFSRLSLGIKEEGEMGALVRIHEEGVGEELYLIAPCLGGQIFSLPETGSVTLVTPDAPRAKALLGKHAGDVVIADCPEGKTRLEIRSVC